jgi:hypothetical protein
MDNVGGTLTYRDDELLVFFRFKTTAVEHATETRDLLDAPFGNANILLTLAPPLNDHVGRVVHQYAPKDLTELDRVELVDGTLTVGFELEIDTGGSTVSTPECWPQDDVGDCYCPYEGFDARASVVVSLPYSGQ